MYLSHGRASRGRQAVRRASPCTEDDARSNLSNYRFCKRLQCPKNGRRYPSEPNQIRTSAHTLHRLVQICAPRTRLEALYAALPCIVQLRSTPQVARAICWEDSMKTSATWTFQLTCQRAQIPSSRTRRRRYVKSCGKSVTFAGYLFKGKDCLSLYFS